TPGWRCRGGRTGRPPPLPARAAAGRCRARTPAPGAARGPPAGAACPPNRRPPWGNAPAPSWYTARAGAPRGAGPGGQTGPRGPLGALAGLRDRRGDHGAALVGLEPDRPEVVREELAGSDRHDLDAQVAVGQEQVVGRGISADEDGAVAGQLVIAAKGVERSRVDGLPPPEGTTARRPAVFGGPFQAVLADRARKADGALGGRKR